MKKRIMICVSAAEWEGIQHRPHHFMLRCSQSGWTILYLEPPSSLIAPIKNKMLFERWKKWKKGLRQVRGNLYVLAPPPVIPFFNKFRSVNKVNQFLLAITVKRAVRVLAGKNCAIELYSFLPNTVDMLPHLSVNRIVYDCVDDHGAFKGLIDPETVYGMEKELMGAADICFATAKKLYKARTDWSGNLHLVPNGADYEHFAYSHNMKNERPGDLDKILHPIAGFVGGISDWIDIELLKRVAEKADDISFVLIGPISTDVEALSKLPNVFLLGMKPYEELPMYVNKFDVCLIPFKVNKLTQSVNPIKLFEYLSAGKPVVSTPIPEAQNYKDVIEIAGNEEEMFRAIKNSLLPDSEENIERRKQVGRNNSWDARWQYVLAHLSDKTTTELPEENTYGTV